MNDERVLLHRSSFLLHRFPDMAVFTYKATDPARGQAARAQTGTIAADTPRQARDRLRERGLVVQDLAGADDRATSRRIVPARRGTRRHETTTFVRELSTLLGVGVPL